MLDETLRGVSGRIYQARGGKWHAHLTRDDKACYGSGLRPSGPPTTDELEFLGNTLSWFRMVLGGKPSPWGEVGHCDSEEEARERLCVALGALAGYRLAQATQRREVVVERGVREYDWSWATWRGGE